MRAPWTALDIYEIAPRKGGGGGGSQPQTSTVQQSSQPWSGLQPFLEDLYGEAQAYFESDQPQFFPGETVVPYSPQTEAALGFTEARSLLGSPIQDVGRDQYLNTLQGDYAAYNPFLDSAIESAARPMVEAFQESTVPALQNAFSMGGRYGSNAFGNQLDQAQDTLMQNVGDLTSQMSLGNYMNERGLMNQAILGAPEYAQQDYRDVGQLANVGRARESLAQEQLGSDIERHNFEENILGTKLAQYSALLEPGSQFGSSTSTSTSPFYRGGNALGAAGLGLQAVSTVAPFITGGK